MTKHSKPNSVQMDAILKWCVIHGGSEYRD